MYPSRMRLYKGMHTIVVKIHLEVNRNRWYDQHIWCDDIELFIEYGTEVESRPSESTG